MTATKVCPTCKRDLPRTEFGTRIAASGNVVSASRCRECARLAARASYDSAKAAARYRLRKSEDPEGLRKVHAERSARYRAANRELQQEKLKEWRRKNRDHVAKYARTYAIENRAIKAAWERQRNARKRNLAIVPFTKAQLAARWSMFPGCWMCGGPKETADHVKPLSAGGAHMLSNLRPACVSCNSRKRSRWPFSVEMLNVSTAA